MNPVYVLHLGHVILGVYTTRDNAEHEGNKFSRDLSTPVTIDRVVVDRPA